MSGTCASPSGPAPPMLAGRIAAAWTCGVVPTPIRWGATRPDDAGRPGLARHVEGPFRHWPHALPCPARPLRGRHAHEPVAGPGLRELQAELRPPAQRARRPRRLDPRARHPGHQRLVRGRQGHLRHRRDRAARAASGARRRRRRTAASSCRSSGRPASSAHEVPEATGFRVVYGPVRAEDLPAFLDARHEGHARDAARPLRPARPPVLMPVELVTGRATPCSRRGARCPARRPRRARLLAGERGARSGCRARRSCSVLPRRRGPRPGAAAVAARARLRAQGRGARPGAGSRGLAAGSGAFGSWLHAVAWALVPAIDQLRRDELHRRLDLHVALGRPARDARRRAGADRRRRARPLPLAGGALRRRGRRDEVSRGRRHAGARRGALQRLRPVRRRLPARGLRLRDKRAVLADRGACMECGACARNCETGAVRVRAGVGCAAGVLAGLLARGGPTCGCYSARAVEPICRGGAAHRA